MFKKRGFNPLFKQSILTGIETCFLDHFFKTGHVTPAKIKVILLPLDLQSSKPWITSNKVYQKPYLTSIEVEHLLKILRTQNNVTSEQHKQQSIEQFNKIYYFE